MDQAQENASSENGEAQHRQVKPRQMSISSDEVNYLIYRQVIHCCSTTSVHDVTEDHPHDAFSYPTVLTF